MTIDETLAARRQRLIAQAASQRAALSQQIEPWRARLAVADRGVAVVRTAGRHPLLLTGVAVLLQVRACPEEQVPVRVRVWP